MIVDPLRLARENGAIVQDEFEAWVAARGWGWRALERGDYDITLDEAIIAYVMSDPVTWAQTFLIEPDSGDRYKLFDYQKESLRSWRQDVVHQDGAEVGKTREITVLILWGCCTGMGGTVANPWMLIGAPQQTHLDEIILAVEEQVGAQEGGTARGRMLSAFWSKPKRTPHTMHRFVSPNPIHPDRPSVARVYYRPAGHDAEAFRGVHVNALAMFDEAAKAKSPLHFSEFFRALKPGCPSRFYSVPDGDNSSPYYLMTQQATLNLPEGQPGRRKFHWPKTLMPPPFWTPERDKKFQVDFNGRNSPGYVRNVLGEHGQAENPVWPWDLLMRNVTETPRYRVMRLTGVSESDSLYVEINSANIHREGSNKFPVETTEFESFENLAEYVDGSDRDRRAVMRSLMRERLQVAPPGQYIGGGDLGEGEPTELIISEMVGNILVDVLRVYAQGLPYHAVRELIYAVDEHFGGVEWGIDLGSAGTVVVRDMQTLDDYSDIADRIQGYQFASTMPCVGEDGETLMDTDKHGDERQVEAPAKHWATQCITKRLQQRGYGMAYDREVLQWMSNHTAREGARHRIYSKQDDHAIDARRLQMLRLLENRSVPEVFAGGAYERAHHGHA